MDAAAGRHHAQREQGRLGAAGESALAAVLFRLGSRQKDASQGHDLHHAGRQHPIWIARGAPDDARGRPAGDFSTALACGGRIPRCRRSARLAPARQFARGRVAHGHGRLFSRRADGREVRGGLQGLARTRPDRRRGAGQTVRQDFPHRSPRRRVRARCRRHSRSAGTRPGGAGTPRHPGRRAYRRAPRPAVLRAQPRRLSPVPRVLVADPIAEAGIARLREHAEVDVQLKQSPASLVARIPEYDALIVRSETRVDANVIQAGTRLKVIGRAGAGVDNIDVEAATRAGVLVVNAPSGNTIAATEHTMAMMLALARHIPQADQAVKAGRWERSRLLGTELREVVTTPHLGASTEEAQISVALEITDQVIAVLDGGLPRFALNAPVALPEAMAFLRPFIPVAEGIGRFFAQAGRQPATRLQVDYVGEIATYDCSVLTAALLTAFLSRFSAERVNPVNARAVAAAHGITVVEQRAAHPTEFANLISLQAAGEHGSTRVGGTLLLNEPHIVQFNDFRIDLVPQGTFLMSWHADRPGVIGAIGTLLGQRNINIASMQVGRERPRGDAVMILSVDDPVPESILADIRQIPGMADVLSVSL